MQEPTRFGNHLLLKKLGEDPLGGTYRAARIEGESLGQLVFLRIFSISSIDAKALVASMREYGASAARLKAPGVTHAVDCGAVSGVAYAAYEYVTGWDLKELLRTANAAYSTLERDHALLLAERIAKGLDIVHQADPSVVRPCHGFMTPQNVLITSEGEIRLMGFESAAFLAAAMAQGQLSPEIKGYVSPEMRSGAAPGPPDDIYALGAILWELLTGVPPSAEGAGMAANLASAKLTSGEPLPAGLGELLQSSLVAERARTPRAGAWHKQLTDWLTRNEVRTTHFDLAFSVHELFRKRIQAEEEELTAEKSIDLHPKLAPAPPPPAAAPAPPAAAATPSSAAVPALERTDVVIPPERKSGKGMLLGVAALVAVVAGVGWFLLSRRPEAPEAPVAAPPPVEAPATEPAEPARSEGLQLAQAELERLVRERAQAVGEQLSAEYDEHIRSLQEQLREAQAAEEEARRLALETAAAESAAAESAAAESAAAEGAAAESPSTPPAGAANAPPPPAAPQPAPAGREAASSPQETPPPTGSGPPPAAPSPPPETPAPVSPPPPATTTTVQAAPPPPPAPPHQPVVIPPRLKRIPEPVYPARARQLRRESTVLLKVLVAADGSVVDAKPVVENDDTFGFIQSAVRAARGGSFHPATTDGVATQMWTTVVITFKM